MGPYRVDGEIRNHNVSLFDPKVGAVTDRIESTTISMDVGLNRDPKLETLGQSFNMHMVAHAKTTLRTELEAADEPRKPATSPSTRPTTP